ncbi:MAG TPA: TSUP family transporter [Candidatus Tumulicola sp.]|nr:TSUP family transporter [Candidatus Tumulicola sp.]
MPHTDPWVIAVLGAVAFVAATIDAVAGGGGLVNVPALLLAGLPVQMALGTNKLAGIAGTATATVTFASARAIRWHLVASAMIAALLGSVLGAHAVLNTNPTILRIVVIVLVLLVSLVITVFPQLGQDLTRQAATHSIWRSGTIGLALGFYDGFFGPGAGLFMVFLFVAWLGLDFLHATGMAKAANFASNLGSVVIFALAGAIDYRVGVVMAACAIAGGFTGSRLAILRGAPFVRYVFLAMTWVLASSLLWQILRR